VGGGGHRARRARLLLGGAARLIEVRPIDVHDHPWVARVQAASWDGVAARRGELIPLAGLPGFIARMDGERVGLLTYAIRAGECEVVTIESRVDQRWGLDLVAFRRGAIDDSRRRLKPSIPERGVDGVPIAHELELELRPG
jgi:hypothetical protein